MFRSLQLTEKCHLDLLWVISSQSAASGEFEEVSREVIALHTCIKELEEDARNPVSLLNRKGKGKKKDILLRNCVTVLRELQQLVKKYRSLGTYSKRAWDRIRFGSEATEIITRKTCVPRRFHYTVPH